MTSGLERHLRAMLPGTLPFIPLTLPRLDRGILFAAAKKDRPVKPGEGERK
jgi:hypothetical protein